MKYGLSNGKRIRVHDKNSALRRLPRLSFSINYSFTCLERTRYTHISRRWRQSSNYAGSANPRWQFPPAPAMTTVFAPHTQKTIATRTNQRTELTSTWTVTVFCVSDGTTNGEIGDRCGVTAQHAHRLKLLQNRVGSKRLLLLFDSWNEESGNWKYRWGSGSGIGEGPPDDRAIGSGGVKGGSRRFG